MEQQVVISQVSLTSLLAEIRNTVTNVINENKQAQLKAELLSPANTCKLFNPEISKVTLHDWTKRGLLTKHRIGGRVYYKYDEVMEAVIKLKRYDRDKG